MKTTIGVAALVLAPMVALESPAHAATWQCAKTATVTKVDKVTKNGPHDIMRFGPGAPTGASWTPKPGDDALQRTHFYELRGVDVTINYGGAIETLSGGAVVMLTCTGVAVGTPVNVPNLKMLNGTVEVQTTKGVPASVSTEEGLFGPVPGSAAMKYMVDRELKNSDVPFMQALLWYGDYDTQPPGTTTTKTLGNPLKVNVTPYVGPQPGTCRHVDSAKLTTGRTAGHGTATYS